MTIKALMMDVDGVLVEGRPQDGLPWQTSLEKDLGFTPAALYEHFFVPHWESIVLGHARLLDHLTVALQKIASDVSPARFVSYWFERDSRLNAALLQELSLARAGGLRVYLTTNQEHLRAAYLMNELGLAEYVDGIFYSAHLGVKKPDTDFFMEVQAAVELDSEELLLIDDSQPNVEAARQAGWRAHHWTRHSLPESLRELYGFSDVQKHLERLMTPQVSLADCNAEGNAKLLSAFSPTEDVTFPR